MYRRLAVTEGGGRCPDGGAVLYDVLPQQDGPLDGIAFHAIHPSPQERRQRARHRPPPPARTAAKGRGASGAGHGGGLQDARLPGCPWSFFSKRYAGQGQGMPGEGRPGPAGAAFVTGRCLYHINTFATGDTALARQLLDENYIQHNLAYGTGEDAFVASVEGLAAAPVKTTVHNIRAFADGDYVFLQTVYNFAGAGDQVAFDIFRFDEDGEVAEHWDVMETIADEST